MHVMRIDLINGQVQLMPDSRKLKVGDRVRFVSLPEEWDAPEYRVPAEDVAFMKAMIARTWPSRVCKMDEQLGYAWIQARTRKRGRIIHHGWMLAESTGWRLVGKA